MRTSFRPSDLCSIIVAFQTKINEFTDILKKHQDNFQQVIVVNNTPEIDFSQFQSKQVTIINNPCNIGLAAALNIGILEAKKRGATMVALFDQDSSLENSFVEKMLQSINSYRTKKKVSIFSPIYFNEVTEEYGPHITFGLLKKKRTKPNTTISFFNPHFVITSGSFIPISSLDDLGLMREELFIDFIDVEWCLRANKKGYEIVSFPKIQFNHRLGDYAFKILGRSYPIHSPIRMYYYFRNAVYLYRQKDIDLNWRLIDARIYIPIFLLYMIFIKNRPTYLKYIIKGCYHGLIKKMGKLEE